MQACNLDHNQMHSIILLSRLRLSIELKMQLNSNPRQCKPPLRGSADWDFIFCTRICDHKPPLQIPVMPKRAICNELLIRLGCIISALNLSVDETLSMYFIGLQRIALAASLGNTNIVRIKQTTKKSDNLTV